MPVPNLKAKTSNPKPVTLMPSNARFKPEPKALSPNTVKTPVSNLNPKTLNPSNALKGSPSARGPLARRRLEVGDPVMLGPQGQEENGPKNRHLAYSPFSSWPWGPNMTGSPTSNAGWADEALTRRRRGADEALTRR
eukprot:1183070-Prorocentrum_minimum.AAC.2